MDEYVRIARATRVKLTVIARLDRAIQYAAASRSEHHCLWNTGSPAFAGDDSPYDGGQLATRS
jgi:hypothetical protein